ncbi:MAG TPA: nucleotidyltransferase family protein [Halanaerobiales bacterium]|nr:nucleotidyltransferase family protein [Halanaerobiales bacterium]
MKSEDIIIFLKNNKYELEKYGINKIGLFGSYAKNQENEYSDIDILVEFKEGNETFDNYMDLKFYLEERFNKKVDLVIAENIKEDLKKEILGSVIYA